MISVAFDVDVFVSYFVLCFFLFQILFYCISQTQSEFRVITISYEIVALLQNYCCFSLVHAEVCLF